MGVDVKFLRKAYSLIELMIVVSLICLLMSLTVSNVSFFKHGYARIELEKLYALCRYAQQKALMTNTAQTITFSPASNPPFYVFGNLQEPLPDSVIFGVPAGIKGPPATPTCVIDAPITFKNAQIIFYPDGIMSAGTVYISDADKKTAYALTCGVSQVSFLRAYRYDKGWRLLSDS
jgi:prepilin-type N-terminal cleavage/methylation domain-containing protein